MACNSCLNALPWPCAIIERTRATSPCGQEPTTQLPPLIPPAPLTAADCCSPGVPQRARLHGHLAPWHKSWELLKETFAKQISLHSCRRTPWTPGPSSPHGYRHLLRAMSRVCGPCCTRRCSSCMPATQAYCQAASRPGGALPAGCLGSHVQKEPIPKRPLCCCASAGEGLL